MRKAYAYVCLGLVALAACGDNQQGNRPPIASDREVTTPEDTPVSITVSANDPDPDDSLVFQFSSPEHGTMTQDGGTITYRPDDDYNGPDAIHVDITDGTYEVDAALSITVTPVNDAPVASDDALAATEDTSATATGTALVANDTDIENDALTVVAVGNASVGTVALAADVVTFTPPSNFVGTATFEYTVSDGAADGTGTVTVTVGGVNDPPVAVDDTATTPEDMPATIPAAMLVGNDTDTETQSLSVTGVGGATNGTVSLVTGTVTFTPDPNFNGTGGFDYTVSDGAATDTGHVTMTVTAVNDTPIANAGSAMTNEDTAVTITLTGSDVEGSNLTFSVGTQPTNGSLSAITPVNATSATVVYTPASNSTMDDSFTFRVNDGTIDSAPATVAVDVVAVNDPPVAFDDSSSTTANTAVDIPTSQLLSNDTDIDNLPADLSVMAVQNPVDGMVSIDAGRTTVTFTPRAGFSGNATFEYVVTDGAGADVGLVTVAVQATQVCGDNTTTGTEQCDDGNFVDVDGCTSECVIGVVCNVANYPGGDDFAVDPATGNCYVSFDTENTTFTSAQSACVALGGYLATITSDGEDLVVRTVHNTAQNPWIGAVDDANDTDAIFAWVTGEAFSYAHFASGQPDDDAGLGGSGECLHLLNAASEWNDTNCNITSFVVGRICEFELAPCGDGVRQAGEGEECDDGNTSSSDGCSATCQVEDGCGDGNLDAGEECDDNDLDSGDGCSATCQLEDGCGDGNLDAGEECDDNNIASGDGCSATCQLEDGCGDGNLDVGEECDDDNLASADGCSATCTRELVSIAITPDGFTIDQQQRVQLRATGTFGPPGQQVTNDVTASATWNSSDPTRATVGTGGVFNGRVEGQVLAGAANITATIGSVVGTTQVTVSGTVCRLTVNEVQASGANAADEWIELYNSCAFPIDVTGWTLNYRAATTTGATDSTLLQTLTGILQPGDFRLYASASAPMSITSIADGTWASGGTSGALGGTNGSVGLRSGATSVGPLVDSLAYGTVTAGHPFIETTPAPAAVANRSFARLPFNGRDSNNNSIDFTQVTVGSTTPRTTNTP